jgi:hypothetical protein
LLDYKLSSVPFASKGFIDGIHESFSVLVVLTFFDVPCACGKDGQIFSHVASLNGLDNGFLEGSAESSELAVVVDLGSVVKSSSPGEDRGNWVGGGALSILPLSVVTSNCTMGSLRLKSSIFI